MYMESSTLLQLCNHLCLASDTQCYVSDVHSSSVVISQCCILFHCVRVIWFVFILLLMDLWVFSSLELQPQMLTWSFWYVSLVSTVRPSAVIIVSRMTRLYGRAGICLDLEDMVKQFSKGALPIYTPTGPYESSSWSTVSPALILSFSC